jgi:hypothetical protein
MGARPSNPKTVDPERLKQQQQQLRHSRAIVCAHLHPRRTGEANYPASEPRSVYLRVTLSRPYFRQTHNLHRVCLLGPEQNPYFAIKTPHAPTTQLFSRATA